MSKVDKFQKILITILIAVSFFYGGYYFGKRGYLFEIRRNPPKIEIINRAPSTSDVDFSLFWQVWDMVSSDYLERPVDTQKMLYGAITGMVESLGDPYTSYLTPDLNKAIKQAINGSYQGIGAELGLLDGQLIVISPLDGSPAKEVGIMPGDKILEIEGISTAGLTVNEAVLKIRGDAGTVSTLKLQRGDEEPFVVKIQRRLISQPSVVWEDKGDGTLYLRVSRFGDETNNDWTKAVNEANVQMDNLDAVVVDVRGNPGGYLQSAYFLADEFVQKGTILWQESATGQQTPMDAKRNGTFENIPAVFVLIDEGSASASEILAAALRENIDAKLVGAKSFGKGTIQDAKDFKDGSGVHLTIAKWLTPDKNWVHKNGLDPDITVEISAEDLQNSKDTQLEKVLELAKEI